MDEKRPIEQYSVEELEHLLYSKKRAVRRKRLQRLKVNGRLVQVDGLEAPVHQSDRAAIYPAVDVAVPGAVVGVAQPPSLGKRIANKVLVVVEVTAVVGLLLVMYLLWDAQSSLNSELAQAQYAEALSLAPPTATPPPVIDLVVLPTGHRYIDGRSPEPVESGDIPAHLLPALQAYQPPPIPTPGPEQARLIEIPAIGVYHPIVPGVYDWEQLKRGVGHHIGSAQPGQEGNMVLAAHNDIYGEIFRDLDQLSVGDEIRVSTDLRTYTYVVRDIQVVEPTDVSVMEPTDFASATLISCYPYRINTQRIVVFADLVTETLNGQSG
jgi:sortase A